MSKKTADWVSNLELKGKKRDEALSEAARRIAEWGLTMPDGEPLAIHFGLGRFMEVGEIEYWVANDESKGYCGKFLFLFEDQRCPSHHHPVKDETFFIMRGSVEMTAGGKTFTMREGSTFKMPPNTEHTFRAVGGPSLVLEVSQPSMKHDNFFADKAIGDNGVI